MINEDEKENIKYELMALVKKLYETRSRESITVAGVTITVRIIYNHAPNEIVEIELTSGAYFSVVQSHLCMLNGYTLYYFLDEFLKQINTKNNE